MNILPKIKEFFQSILDRLVSIYDGIVAFLMSVWNWLVDTVYSVCQYLFDVAAVIWDKFTDLVSAVVSWVLDWCWYGAKWAWEILIFCADTIVKFFLAFFQWFLEQLPDMGLPDGFNTGLQYIISYAMILDKILPVHECLFFLGVYFAAVVTIGIIRLIVRIHELIIFN